MNTGWEAGVHLAKTYLTLSISCFKFPKILPLGCSGGRADDDGVGGAVVAVKDCEGIDVDGGVDAVFINELFAVGAGTGTVTAATPGCAAFRQVTYAGLHQ